MVEVLKTAATVAVIAACIVLLVWASIADAKDKRLREQQEAEDLLKELGEYVLSPSGRRFRIVKETRLNGHVLYRRQIWHDIYKSQKPRWENCTETATFASLEQAQDHLEKLFDRDRAELIASQVPVLPSPEPQQ